MPRSFALAAFFLAVGVAAGALVLAAPGAAAAPPADVPVAVVDLLKCVREHPAYAKSIQRIKDAETEAKKKRDDDLKAFAERRAQLEKRQPNEPGYVDELRQLEKYALTIKFDFEWANRVASEEMMRTLTSIYDNVKGLVSTYARNNRIPLVVQMTEERLQAKSPDEFTANVIVRSAVHWDHATMNITDAILAQVKASAPPPGK